MVNKIVHMADIHIRKTPTRNFEYGEVFKRVIKSLKDEKPDRIVIVGDLVNDYLDLQGEQLIMAYNFLKDMSMVAPVRITRGNHDCRKINLNRVDSIEAIVSTLKDYDIKYYNKTGFYTDDNITWGVWHHGDKNNNPWKNKDGKKILKNPEHYFTIDLFHDPITGCKSTSGFEMKSKSYYKISDFRGDLSLFGDIHKFQYLDKNKTKAYCGSLVEQDISEGDGDFHGYLVWDVATKTATQVPIKNDYTHHNIKITPYIDFDDLDFEIENPTSHMWVRFLWGTLPATRNSDNERAVTAYVKSLYKNLTISHKNEFIESEEIEVNEDVTLENISDVAVQQDIFKDYLTRIGIDETLINDVIALDEEIFKSIDVLVDGNIEWNVVKFGGTNFMSYEKLDIDWRDMNGLFQISGVNTAGKTTIMKILTYILFGKTLETKDKLKFGDKRFVNNRNGAKFCDGYIVIEANGEYYGIKKMTRIETKKDGTINGAPTSLSYYVLANPDDVMDDNTAIEKLDGDRKDKTQKKINSIIGSYDNFMRIVMTTSDTLNNVLSNDMAVFIDSLLYDSGLDIFDKKLEGLKVYQKRVNEKSRVVCNVEATTNANTILRESIKNLQDEIKLIDEVNIPEIQNRVVMGRTHVENLTKRLYHIDQEIYSLNVDECVDEIKMHKTNIDELSGREGILIESINSLINSFDEEKLVRLNQERDNNKQLIYDKKLEIKSEEKKISDWQHEIEIENGKIFVLKRDGKKMKDNIAELKKSKTCITCGQPLTADHQIHIDETIINVRNEMMKIVDEIKLIENNILSNQAILISSSNERIKGVNDEIVRLELNMEGMLNEIGVLNNERNDVERRKHLQVELNMIPTKIQNEELKIDVISGRVSRHKDSLKQIKDNKETNRLIILSKEKINELELKLEEFKEDVFIRKTSIADKILKIKNNDLLIAEFKIQEYQDKVLGLYKKCVHRDGIPRQMLVNYIIPKINKTLSDVLSMSTFRVWLDENDLKPKLTYNDRPDSIIDCISASGKERTFSSVILKFALNQINVKSKPSIFLLDEVMGKLDEDSVSEFKGILQIIKDKMSKVLVIEHSHEINPDYLINVGLSDEGISSLNIE